MKSYATFFFFLVLIEVGSNVVSHTEEEVSLEYPDVFTNAEHDASSATHCEGNAVVAAWCDSQIFPELQCAILPQFNEYGCSCVGHASLCPTECIGDSKTIAPSEPVARTHERIRCLGIPRDAPNYVLGSSAQSSSSRRSGHRHSPTRHAAGCHDNAIVASWCDESINPHLQCFLHPELDQYKCHCSGKHSYCPDECIGGSPPAFPHTTSDVIVCRGIPDDSPNYILQEA